MYKKFYIRYISSTSSFYKNLKFYNFLINFLLIKKNFVITIPVQKLDNILLNDTINSKKNLLKIDVEGAEFDVLKGAKKTIKKVSYILLENKFLFKNYKKKIEDFLLLNNFSLEKKWIYPFLNFEDRLYKCRNLKN